jgi:hypothetical protein
MSVSFSRWLTENWQNTNVTLRQTELFNDWLLGQVEGLKRGLITVSHQVDAEVDEKPPYRSYVKYRVVANNVDRLLDKNE